MDHDTRFFKLSRCVNLMEKDALEMQAKFRDNLRWIVWIIFTLLVYTNLTDLVVVG